jgi:hypothetical protein
MQIVLNHCVGLIEMIYMHMWKVEGPDWWPGGSEWESIKISPTQNRLSPKLTTKDSHTNLSRSCSHSRPTNPRNKSKLYAKWKHNSRSKALSQICMSRTDRSWEWFGPSVGQVQIVRIKHREPLEAPRTTRTIPLDSTGCPTLAHGPSVKPLHAQRQNSHGSTDMT